MPVPAFDDAAFLGAVLGEGTQGGIEHIMSMDATAQAKYIKEQQRKGQAFDARKECLEKADENLKAEITLVKTVGVRKRLHDEMEKEDLEKNNEKLSARATNAERTDQTETAEANLEVNRKRRGWAEAKRNKVDAAMTAKIAGQDGTEILEYFQALPADEADAFVGKLTQVASVITGSEVDQKTLAQQLVGAGTADSDIFSAFKSHNIHFDTKTGRLSVKSNDTARDSAALKLLLESLNLKK